MKILKVLFVAAILIIAVLVLKKQPKEKTTLSQNSTPQVQQSLDKLQTAPIQNWETKVDRQGLVEIEVTPLEFSPEKEVWKFQIGLSTHSVELNEDLTKVVTLKSDNGQIVYPMSWDGPVGGHHRAGTLSFQPVKPWPKLLTLIINNIGGVKERTFSWELK